MSSRIVFLLSSLVGCCVLIASWGEEPAAGSSGAENSDLVRRGEFLVTIGGCGDCHTPKVFTPTGPEPDPSRLLSGHPEGTRLPHVDPSRIGPDQWLLFNNQLTAAVGPWGVSFAANITSDEETGIGRWNAEAFMATMRTGKHWGVGPQLVPPMPWQNLAHLPDEDLRAIFAYLKSTRPIRNRVPAAMTLEEFEASVQRGASPSLP